MLVGALAGTISSVVHASWLKYLNLLFTLAILYYLYKAMRNFYDRAYGKPLQNIFC